ncbi:MAG: hypothetical protein ACTHMC_24365 [Pseudobacter sp.]|uniref:hypothetical protein n=1 Tax=Pseudobacter sp. TaxID=2045420 RepID=UPI003F7F833C
MVRGIEVFREHFAAFAGHYVIIGGTACDLVIEEADLEPRATRDYDIILVIEALTPDFVRMFWEFIKMGGYQRTEKNEEDRKYYRFQKPTDERFPFQLELFSRVPDILTLPEEAHLTPIPVDDDDLSSLSAILMDDHYYGYTLAFSQTVNGIHRANPEALICLKAKAFLDMTERRERGEQAEKKHISKHKADVFRLVTLLSDDSKFDLPEALKKDLFTFVMQVKDQLPNPVIFKEMGLGNMLPEKLWKQLTVSFGLEVE